MPGRQSHGRPLLGQPKSAPRKSQKAKPSGSRAAALNAFASAERAVPISSGIRGSRARDLDAAPNLKKRHRGEDDEDNDDEDEAPSRSRNKRTRSDKGRAGGDNGDEDGSESEYGTDDEGNEFRIGAVGSEDDSELDSDEAFGESDEERFDGFVFRGSSSTKKSTNGAKTKSRGEDDDSEGAEDENEDDGDDGSSLGEDAIDLAQALDQLSDDDDEDGSAGDTESGSEDDDDGDSSSSGSAPSEGEEDDEDDNDPSKLDALKTLVSGFAGQTGEEDEDAKPSSGKAKLSLKDLGLFGVKDSSIKKSLKLMQNEEKAISAGKPGAARKLDVPLSRRHQDKLLRVAASEQANKTLDRWQDTVKHNRRAEHLVFPLPDTAHDAGLNKGELAPLFDSGSTSKSGGTELEQTILSIMEESGLGPSKPAPPPPELDAEGNPLSHAELQELWAQRRRDREKQSREQARAARIKKIKSKAYRRVHRKERKARELEEAELAGPMDAEEEREAQHRARALERVGARHRDSKWAKSVKRAGIAAWDEGARTGLMEMARRNDELRRRVEGRPAGDEEEDEEDDSGSEGDERAQRMRLLRELEQAAADHDDEPQSDLMQMKFMQRGEAERKQANDELVAQIRRELLSDDENEDGSDGSEDKGPAEIGRRTYGLPGAKTSAQRQKPSKGRGPKTDSADLDENQLEDADAASSEKSTINGSGVSSTKLLTSNTSGNAWSRAGASRSGAGTTKSKKGQKGARSDEALIDISQPIVLESKAKKTQRKQSSSSKEQTQQEDAASSDSDADAVHLPLAVRDQELADRAFAGDEMIDTFEKEKADLVDEDDEKVIDNTLPGWGSWVGEGVSNREKKKHQGRFLTKVDGVKKQNRKDAKLERVIISEKRVKKNDKYLASQLPHVFENKDQYERSLRLPVGPEWTTKQTFQASTKPRILMKQGIIAPMAKPLSQ